MFFGAFGNNDDEDSDDYCGGAKGITGRRAEVLSQIDVEEYNNQPENIAETNQKVTLPKNSYGSEYSFNSNIFSISLQSKRDNN